MKVIQIVLFFIFSLLFISIYTFAQNIKSISFVGRWPDGVCEAVYLDSNYAYVGNGAALDILDVSNPSSPIRIGRVIASGLIRDIHIVGDFVYILTYKAGLQIVDIEDPLRPLIVGNYETYNTMGWIENLFAIQNYVYIAGEDGIIIIDVSNPFSPAVVDTFITSNFTLDVFISDNIAFATVFNEGLYILDISDPASPTTLTVFHLAGNYFPNSIFVLGNYVYVTSYESRVMFNHGRLHIIDISNPNSPRETGSVWLPGDWSGSGNKVYVDDGNAYVTYSSDVGQGFVVVDLSDLTFPTIVANVSMHSPDEIYARDKKVYVTDGTNGLKIFDVTDPAFVQEIANFDTRSSTRGVFIKNNYAYIANNSDGLIILDINDPMLPVEIGSFDRLNNKPLDIEDVFVSDDFCYIAHKAGFAIVDVANPDSIEKVGSITNISANKIQIKGNFAYLAGKGLHIIDISDPQFPAEVALFKTNETSFDIYISELYGYLASGSSGLYIIDISDPSNPVEVNRIPTNGYSHSVFVNGQFAYLADGPAGLRVFNISDPVNPVELNNIPAMSHMYSIEIEKGYAYIAELLDGLRVLDVSNPDSIFDVGFFNTGHMALDVNVFDNLIYVADHLDGFYILKNDLLPGDSVIVPLNFYLKQNYPNPFNAITNITYSIKKPTRVQLKIFNVRGQLIEVLVDEFQETNEYTIQWDAFEYGSGVYFYRLQAGQFFDVKKGLLIK